MGKRVFGILGLWEGTYYFYYYYYIMLFCCNLLFLSVLKYLWMNDDDKVVVNI